MAVHRTRTDEQGGLELIDLHRRYGEVVALDGFSLRARPGAMHGFVGTNGAGKTTAMRIAIGLLEPDSGAVHWQGHPITAEQRRRIGYMPEERGLYPKMEVAAQLRYLAELHGVSAGEAARRVDHWLERLGVRDRAGDRVEALSLGNQQRIQLAASLVFEPEILILDEPFSGLDPIGVDVLSGVLEEFCRERQVPVVFSSHQLDLVERLCDEVTIIKQGRLVAAGTVAELRESRGGEMWRLELVGGRRLDPAPSGIEALGGDLYRLGEDYDPQRLLAHGQAVGRVRRFEPVQPSLTELFREAVAADESEEAGAAVLTADAEVMGR
jgi:ABC-2 type transport system ATP-binding protein